MRSWFQSPTSPSTVSSSAPYIMSSNVHILAINVLKSVAKKLFFYRGASMIFSTKKIQHNIITHYVLYQRLRGPFNCKHWDWSDVRLCQIKCLKYEYSYNRTTLLLVYHRNVHVSCSVKFILVLMENERRSGAGGCLSVYAVRNSRSL